MKTWLIVFSVICLMSKLDYLSAQSRPLTTGKTDNKSSRREPAVSGTNKLHKLNNIDQLRTLFQKDKGKVRLIALLSPT